MKCLWKCSLGLTLGLLAAGGQAQEIQWRPARVPNTAAGLEDTGVTIGAPVAATPRSAAPPRPLIADRHVQPASLLESLTAPTLMVRADTPDFARPMPEGATLGDDGPSLKMPTSVEVSSPPPPTLLSTSPDSCCPLECSTSCECACDGCWDGPGACSSNCFYVSAEYLLWWVNQSHTPALVTRGSEADAIPGALGQPGTVVLFGGNTDGMPHSGGRFTAGWWFNDQHDLGIEDRFMFLTTRTVKFAASSGGTPFLGRPFFDTQAGIENAERVADMEGLTGTAGVYQSTRLWGDELNLRTNLCCGSWYSVDLLGGFRFLDLQEQLGVSENLLTIRDSTRGGVLVPAGTGLQVVDSFKTTNRFYGGQIGSVVELRKCNWELDLRGELAVGSTQESATIGGGTAFISPNGTRQVFPGGLLALGSNSGNFNRDQISVVPELGFNVAYHITENIKIVAGYTFLYWSNVQRPGDLIDRSVNTNLLPPPLPPNGPVHPAFSWKGTDLMAHGVNLGLEIRY